MSKKKAAGITAVILAVVVGSIILTANVLSKVIMKPMKQSAKQEIEGGMPEEAFIGVVEVEGTIQEEAETSVFETPKGYQHTATLEYIDELADDSNNKGILLKVDSPGGTVYESEELYLKLKEYKEKTGRPVWTYMEHYAASGGYMISAASDKIYANSNTTTGSIGVIISGVDASGLYEKLGIRPYSITSGKNKDMSEMNKEQVSIYQEMVDEYYERFVEIVSEGRKMSEKEVKELADGRIYTAKQALKNGLIDEISLYEEMEETMQTELGADSFYYMEKPKNMLAELFGVMSDLKPRSEAEALVDLTETFGKGVPMYYAESLR